MKLLLPLEAGARGGRRLLGQVGKSAGEKCGSGGVFAVGHLGAAGGAYVPATAGGALLQIWRLRRGMESGWVERGIASMMVARRDRATRSGRRDCGRMAMRACSGVGWEGRGWGRSDMLVVWEGGWFFVGARQGREM